MSRSGYSDDYDDTDYPLALYRGAVASSMRGKRGQSLLRELAEAMDAMPVKRLITHDLVKDSDACALGVVSNARGLDVTNLDPYDIESVAGKFNIAECLAREIVYINDEHWKPETPEERWQRMRKWVEHKLQKSSV